MIGPNISIFANRIGSAFSYMLDFFSGAAAAYSLRRLSSSYGGSAIRVRRSLDNAEADIGFGPDGLDTTALMNHVGYENLITYSEQFENAAWNNVAGFGTIASVTSNSTTAPNGTNTADTLTFNGAPVSRRGQSFTIAAGTFYIASVYVKKNTVSSIDFFLDYNGIPSVIETKWGKIGGSPNVNYNFDTDTLTGIGATYGREILSNGWVRLYVGAVAVGTNVQIPVTGFQFASGSFFAWGAQVSTVSLQPYYQTVATANTANGFVTTWYDQSGNTRNATQTTAASQPAIVRSGVIELDNGKPALYFSGSNSLVPQGSNDIFRNVGFANMYAVANSFGSFVDRWIYGMDIGTGPSARVILGVGNGAGYNGFTVGGRRLDGDTFASASDNNYTSSKQLILSGLLNYATSDAYLYKLGLLVAQNTSFQTDGNTTNTASVSSSIGNIYSGPWIGDIQELILYNTNTTSNALPISSSQNSFYQAYWQGSPSALLNQFGGSAAAYSLRNLSSSYRGPLVRVRRSSDNAETDIGGTFSGDLDVASLVSFTGGQNLATNSEDFTQASWVKTGSTVTANAAVAPNGTLTADKLVETAVNNFHRVDNTLSLNLTTSQCTISFYAKAAERRYLAASVVFTTAPFDQFSIVVDLISGSILEPTTTGIASIFDYTSTNVGNGWWRFSLTGTNRKNGSVLFSLLTCENPTTSSYLGVAGSGVYVWGAQLNTGVLQPYVPTTSAAVNGANAFVTTWYDQSGNARHATQATAGSQPRIVNAGGVDSENGRPTLFLDGTDDFFSVTTGLNVLRNVGHANSYIASRWNADPGKLRGILAVSTGGNLAARYTVQGSATNNLQTGGRRLDNDAFASATSTSTVSSSAMQLYAGIAKYQSAEVSQYINGGLSGVNSSFQTPGNTSDTDSISVFIGRVFSGADGSANVDLSEIILYNTDSSSNRTAIESNINNYYKIY
jgi:hypothetical protein